MQFQVQFCCEAWGERTEDRYLARVPQAHEHVSFPRPAGSVPSWECFIVVRVHTFLERLEDRYVVELEKFNVR